MGLKRLFILLAAIVCLTAFAGAARAASGAVAALDERTFVVVSHAGKFVTLYKVVDGRLVVQDATVFSEDPDRTPYEPMSLKPRRVRKR